MLQLIGPAIIVALSVWGLQYTGPLKPENPDFLLSLFLHLLLASSGLSFTIKLIKLPFSRRR